MVGSYSGDRKLCFHFVCGRCQKAKKQLFGASRADQSPTLPVSGIAQGKGTRYLEQFIILKE